MQKIQIKKVKEDCKFFPPLVAGEELELDGMKFEISITLLHFMQDSPLIDGEVCKIIKQFREEFESNRFSSTDFMSKYFVPTQDEVSGEDDAIYTLTVEENGTVSVAFEFEYEKEFAWDVASPGDDSEKVPLPDTVEEMEERAKSNPTPFWSPKEGSPKIYYSRTILFMMGYKIPALKKFLQDCVHRFLSGDMGWENDAKVGTRMGVYAAHGYMAEEVPDDIIILEKQRKPHDCYVEFAHEFVLGMNRKLAKK